MAIGAETGHHGAMFRLDAQLERDTVAVTTLALSHVLLIRDARYPWLILVPARSGVRALHDLEPADGARLMAEITRASRALERVYAPDRINVGALGNIVRQLHVHVVARREGDAAWPGPVWGQGEAVPYDAHNLDVTRDRLAAALATDAAA